MLLIPQETVDLLSVAINYVEFPRILYKWNHAVCIALCLLSFT